MGGATVEGRKEVRRGKQKKGKEEGKQCKTHFEILAYKLFVQTCFFAAFFHHRVECCRAVGYASRDCASRSKTSV